MASNLIGIDGNEPIHRTFRLKHLISDLQAQCLTLVRPRCWDDPFENMITNCAFTYPGGDLMEKQDFFDQSRSNVFAQCWSLGAESDTLWRAYSMVDKDKSGKNTDFEREGVKVWTTPQKILSGLLPSLNDTGFTGFVGLVQYDLEDAILKKFANEIGAKGADAFSAPRSHAESLLWKREPFSHEKEVRLICIGNGATSASQKLSCPIDLNLLIDEMILDPRITSEDEESRIDALRRAGFNGKIGKSQLYQKKLVEVYGFQK